MVAFAALDTHDLRTLTLMVSGGMVMSPWVRDCFRDQATRHASAADNDLRQAAIDFLGALELQRLALGAQTC